MGITRAFCAQIESIGYDSLPGPVVDAARLLFLDGLAVAVAGSREPTIQLLADYYRAFDAREEAVALGLGFRTAAPCAAALNGAAMHVLDFEPMWSPATHALSTTLPAILALAERRRANGQDVLVALVKGIETQGWLREAGHAPALTSETFHPPGVVGPLGSAAASAHILGLSLDELVYAVGIAASRSGSLFANAGTMTKCTHCGHAAQAGLEAALLASRGFTSNPDIIDCRDGFGAAFMGREFDPARLLDAGASYRLLAPGFAIKLFPSQFATHFAIHAGLELSAQLEDVGQVRRISLTTPEMPYVNRPAPATGLQGKFSFQYTFCRALRDGKVTIDAFTDEEVSAGPIRDLLTKVQITMDPAIPARFEAMHLEASVELADGRRLIARCDRPRGAWGEEPISQAEHLVKVRDCLSRCLSPAAVERCVDLGTRLETLDADELAELLALAGAGPGGAHDPDAD